MATERIGERLVKNALITPEQLMEAQKAQRVSGVRLGSQLVKLGYISEEELVGFLGQQYGLPSIVLKNMKTDREAVKLVPANIVQKYNAIPFARSGSTLKVAMTDPSNIFAVDDIKFLTGYSIEVYVTSEESLKWAIENLYGKTEEDAIEDTLSGLEGFEDGIEIDEGYDDVTAGALAHEAEEAPIIKLVNLILIDAIK